jgi:hypothetical protein
MDFIFPCHYPGVFGYILASFQYVPTVILLVIFFITVASPNPFYANLAFTMKCVWFIGICLKYLIIPNTLNVPTILPNDCDGIVAFIFNFIEENFKFSVTMPGCTFPNPDLLQLGSFIGYVFTFHILWCYPIKKLVYFGLLLSIFVPWSYSISDSSNIWNTIGSIVMGIIIGIFALLLSYYCFVLYIENKDNYINDLEHANNTKIPIWSKVYSKMRHTFRFCID